MNYIKGNKLRGGAGKMDGAMKTPAKGGKYMGNLKGTLSVSMMNQGKTMRSNKLSGRGK
jgi:hypothetical protein